MIARALVAAFAVFSLAAAQAATPTHLYLLDDNTDAMAGPALGDLGGTFGSGAYGQIGYSFGVNQGLSLSGAVPMSAYTIDFAVAISETGGYRRLVEFKNLGADTGLYNLNTTLNFYNVSSGPAGAFTASQLVHVAITRDAAGTFSGYVGGTLQFSFVDSSGLAEFSGPAQIAWFFRDDNAVGGEASAGFVDFIRIHDVALSAVEIGLLADPVPEPGSWALMLAGLGALVAMSRKA